MRGYVLGAGLLVALAWLALPGPTMDGRPLYGDGTPWWFLVVTLGPSVVALVGAAAVVGLGMWRWRSGRQ